MRYILTITQKPGTEDSKGDFVYKKDSPFAQKISICCNYYNLTIRVVNLAGEQLAIYDAFHEPDKFVDHFVFCSNTTQNRRMDPYAIRTGETRIIKSSGFLIGVNNDQLRTQIQCTGNQWTQTPAMVFQSSELTEKKATGLSDRMLSAQKDSITRGGWDKQVLKPLQMVTPGEEPPFEELPLDLVDCNDGKVYVTGKVVGIFDARAPECPVNAGTFSDDSANNAMIDCWITARSHTVATCDRMNVKNSTKASEKKSPQASSSDYAKKVYFWDEVGRLTSDEYTDALKRMHQSYHETNNVPDILERRAFYTRGIEVLDSKDFKKYLRESPIFADLVVDARIPERYYDAKRRQRLPTRLGFNYPYQGAFITTQNLYVNEWGYTHKFVSPQEIKILKPRSYLAALEGRVETVLERPADRLSLPNAVQSNPDLTNYQATNQVISLQEIYEAAEKNRLKTTKTDKTAAPAVTTAPAPAIPPAPVMVSYQTAGEHSGFDLIERVPAKRAVKTVICTKLPTPKLNVEEKLTVQEEAGLAELLALDLEDFVTVAEPTSPATPPTPPIVPALSPAGMSLTFDTIWRPALTERIGRANAAHQMRLNQLEQDLAWLEEFEPPSKKAHFADY